MATLAQLRQALASALDSYLSGKITEVAPASATAFTDPNNMARYSEDDALNGVTCHIVSTTDGLAPQGEAVYVLDYTAAGGAITLATGLSDVLNSDDTYALYLKPWITLANWNAFINRAIYESWPELYYTASAAMTLKADYTATLALASVLAAQVDAVILMPSNQMRGQAGQLQQEGKDYIVYGEKGDLTIQLLRAPQPPDLSLLVMYRRQHPTLASESDSTTLDTAFILNQARSEFYLFMAGKTLAKAEADSYLKLANYFRSEAQKRKILLLQSVTGQVQLRT